MPSTSSGRILKTTKGKKGTLHQKNHRWESFTAKISKLNSLDPLRRVRRHDLDPKDLEQTTSYFKNGLETWQNLNVSGGFLEFARHVMPFCDSLPQILHFQDKIMDLLAGHLERNDKDTIEPLLNLLADFAHDLGTRFEQHYGKALRLVIDIVGKHQEADVVEWSFTCLAFMFKYLSRLLVSDLRPTYDIMAPLLGKSRHPPHIARFAAEALSFLIKKAAAPAVREKALATIITHAKNDVLSMFGSRQFELYYHGVMTMLAEAIKGNGLSVHSSGDAILGHIFAQFHGSESMENGENPWSDVIYGVLTSIVHHTSLDTMGAVCALVLEESAKAQTLFKEAPNQENFQLLLMTIRAIAVIVGTRQASRISDWQSVSACFLGVIQLLNANASLVSGSEMIRQVWDSPMITAAIILHYSPMENLNPRVSKYLEAMTKPPFADLFLTFCFYFANLDVGRFKSLVLSYFQRFVVAHWSNSDHVDKLCVLLPQMISSEVITNTRMGKDMFNLPQSWQDQIVSKFERLEVSPFPEPAPLSSYENGHKVWHDQCLPKYAALLEVLDSTAVDPSTNARISEILLRKLKLALRPSSTLASDEANFLVGQGFSTFCKMTRLINDPDESLGPLLRAAAPRYARLPKFLDAMLSYEESLLLQPSTSRRHAATPSNWSLESSGEGDVLVSTLINNLSTESHKLRLLSLRLLQHVHKINRSVGSDAITTMLLIEETPLDLQSGRSLSLHLRKLGAMYLQPSSDPVIKRAIPYFCFGMLTVKYAQLWDDAISTLVQVSEVISGQELIAELAFRWLEVPSIPWSSSSNIKSPRNLGLTDFECSNMMRLNALASEAKSEVNSTRDLMLKRFEDDNQLVPEVPSVARSKALAVLTKIPTVAERKSRQFVPMFLAWADSRSTSSEDLAEDFEPTLSDWSRRDQKAQLGIFALFTNPSVLYKTAEIYRILIDLLANGDSEIQKLALKTILTWKADKIKPYEENLFNLLDDARFKDEVALLLQGQTVIQPEHRNELLPILLRLLYGRAIARKGAASGRRGMENRRSTILRSLSAKDCGIFIEISLGGLRDIDIPGTDKARETMFETEIISVRKQVGFTNMMEDVIIELGTNVAPYAFQLMSALVYCLAFTSRKLQKFPSDPEAEENVASQASLLRDVRQTGLKCLVQLYRNTTGLGIDWTPFLQVIMLEIVQPRIHNLPIQTAQGISGLLRLLSTWSSSPETILYLGEKDEIIPKLAECLSIQSATDEVKLYVISVIGNIVQEANNGTTQTIAIRVKEELLENNMEAFLSRIGNLLSHDDLSKKLLEASVELLASLAPMVSNSVQARSLVETAIFLLNQPSRKVNPKMKQKLLLILEKFIPLYDLQNEPNLSESVFDTISSLFAFFKDRLSREVLSRVLEVFATDDIEMQRIATICADLNSFETGKLDAPDFEKRLQAFIISQEETFSPRQWTPLLFNMLYYVRNEDEHGVLLSNASVAICHFVETASQSSKSERLAFQNILLSILLPALFSGVKEESEHVRSEHVTIMACLIKSFPDWDEVNGMRTLLGGDNEIEASFFKNILAPAKKLRSSALGILDQVSGKGVISSSYISRFFLPLVEQFILNRAEGNEAHNLAAEATTTVGNLAESLEWQQYKAVLRRFISYITSKPDLEKQIIRLISKLIDSLAAAVERNSSKMATVEETTTMLEEDPNVILPLATSLPAQEKFNEDICSNILPPLLDYLHNKDESTVSQRVPVAIIIVRLFKLLPEEQMKSRLPSILTDICQILRSKAQEARDMSRDTLTTICGLIGPSYFGFVLKELRGALTRGYQLHVLSYTMHSILVANVPNYLPGDLDEFLNPIVRIIMDDIFGIVGQEKDAEEYTSKMKEVKSSKSHDSMELIAKTATLNRLTELLGPVQSLLREKLSIRVVRKIDELLNRITNGLLKNTAAASRDSLQFCYDVIQDAYKGDTLRPNKRETYQTRKYLIQKGANRGGSHGSTAVYAHKPIRFAFDVMRAVLKRYDNLRIPSNLVLFVPIIGDALVDGQDEVKIAAYRLLTVIAKVPFKSTEAANLYTVALAQAIKSIKASSSILSEVSQASFKLISTVLRDRQDIQVKDIAIDNLIERIKQDLTDPERRHITFSFLRAVLDSKAETAGVYDILDYVGTIMVTNDDKDTRDLARGTYFQFLREYPQKKNRWSKQLSFIVFNLKYDRDGGRLSILEIIHLLLSNSANDFVQEIAATCFVPLIFVMVNDDNEKCRMAAAELIRVIFERSDTESMQSFIRLLRSWASQHDNPSILQLAFQSYRIYFEVNGSTAVEDFDIIYPRVSEVLQHARDGENDWEILYCALQLSSTLCVIFASEMVSDNKRLFWKWATSCLSYPHAWVKLSAATLINGYLTDFARANIDHGFENLPLIGSQGLQLDAADMRNLIRRASSMLQTPGLPESLATEVVKCLAFLGSCAGSIELSWVKYPVTSEDSDEEDELADDSQEEEDTALAYILRRISFILRRESSPPRAHVLIPKTAALQILQLLSEKLPLNILADSLELMLLPLFSLTDPSFSVPYSTDDLFKAGYVTLKDKGVEIMRQLQSKCGTAVYTAALVKVTDGVKTRRIQRASKRKIEAIVAPDRFGKEKKRKTVRKKERKKEKGQAHREKRSSRTNW